MIDKQYFSILILIIILVTFQSMARADDFDINAKAYILMDFKSGRIFKEKNSDEKRAMASTTKIMTAIIALENGELSSKVKVSNKAASVTGSSFGLKGGEEISLENMLYGLLLCSGNDAAVAIAEHIGGSVENFVILMNAKAIEIGALNTHYNNPHGLDEPNHFSTAKDLAQIACYALKIPQFKKIVSTREKTIKDGNFHKTIYNTNKLLWSFLGVNGIKTGYTGKAGKCLVSSLVKNKHHFIAVILGANDHFYTSEMLLNYGLNNYDYIKIINKQKSYVTLSIKRGIEDRINLVSTSDVSIPVSKSEFVTLKPLVPSVVRAPVLKNEILGELQIFIDDKYLASVPLQASDNIRSLTILDFFYDTLRYWFELKNYF